jgi:type III restriction enzyme
MTLFEKLQEQIKSWRAIDYKCPEFPQIKEILNFNKLEDGSFKFLRKPQFEAIEAYLYLRFVLKTPQTIELYKMLFDDDKMALFKILGISHINKDAIDDVDLERVLIRIKTDTEFVKKHKYQTLHEALNLDYASYILALAMGTGKTILIGSIIAIEFAIAIDFKELETPQDVKLMHNALIFAPGKTIIESLREISEIAFDKILPARLFKKLAPNLKINYTKDGDKRFDGVIEGGLYNILVTNCEKIILRNVSSKNDLFNQKAEEKTLTENLRLQKITSLDGLGVFSDEAHNTYGNNLGDDLKRVRETINHIHKNKDLVCVINTTGTPYFKKEPLKEVVFWYSLEEGIGDNILKSVKDNIVSYNFDGTNEGEIIGDIIKDFFISYGKVRLYSGQMAKIAFYFKSEDHLQDCKLAIEKALTAISQSPTLILVNTQKSSKKEIEDFNKLNSPESQKRVVLLIDKGKEGWNCPSLFATALIREASSSNNFILQASTRCLRQVKENKERAKIYLSSKNIEILDKELQENFNISIGDFGSEDNSKIIEKKAFIRKYQMPKLEIIREVKRVVRSDGELQKLFSLSKPETTANDLSKTMYRFEDGGLKESGFANKVAIKQDYLGVLNASFKIAQNYHLGYVEILNELSRVYPEQRLPTMHLEFLFAQIESQFSKYIITTEPIKEALAIIKIQDADGNYNFEKDDNGVFYHTIRFKEGSKREKLLLEHQDESLGFHLSVYDFDSKPERNFLTKILNILQIDKKDVEDVYFTGSINDIKKTDFYFEYKGKDGKYHNYFPDFIITKKNGEFLIVEIKATGKEEDKEVVNKKKAVSYLEGIGENKFKYVIIYAGEQIDDNNKDFLEVKNFIQ